MKKNKINNNSLVINEYDYEIIIKDILQSFGTSDREVLQGYFINNFMNTKHNKSNNNGNYKAHMSPIQKVYKYYSYEEIYNKIYSLTQDVNTPILLEYKLDGIMINLIYYKGKLTSAITRGDKYGGEDLIDIIKNIVPNILDNLENLEVRGELVIANSQYNNFFSSYVSNRSAILSIIGQKNINYMDVNKMEYYAHDVGIIDKKKRLLNQDQIYSKLLNMGFKVMNYLPYLLKNIKQGIEKIQNNNIDYKTDGIIIKINSYKTQISLFKKYKEHSAYCFAYKDIMKFVAIIKKINISANKNGVYIPTAEISSITYKNIKCKKLNLYSYNIVKKHNIGEGAKVEILYNAIFVFNRTIQETKSFKFPEKCIYCNNKLEILGMHLVCVNLDCSNRTINTITSICKQIGMKSFAQKTIELLVNNGIIKNILDLLNIKSKFSSINIKNFKDKKIQNMVHEISGVLNKISLKQIILCFGISSIGIKTADMISKSINSIEDISNIYNLDFLNKKQKEEIQLFLHNKNNLKIIKEIIKIINNNE